MEYDYEIPELMERLKEIPGKLADAVIGLTETQLDTPYRENGWTVRQVVHHFSDGIMQGLSRICWALTEENTTLKTIEQDAWAKLPDYKLPPAVSLTMIRCVVEKLLSIAHNLHTKDWEKSAIHPEAGVQTVKQLFKIQVKHGETHLQQILSVKNR